MVKGWVDYVEVLSLSLESVTYVDNFFFLKKISLINSLNTAWVSFILSMIASFALEVSLHIGSIEHVVTNFHVEYAFG